MRQTVKFIAERLAEPTTWRGGVMLLTACGVTWRPEMVAAITSAGMGLAGAIGILFPDAPSGE